MGGRACKNREHSCANQNAGMGGRADKNEEHSCANRFACISAIRHKSGNAARKSRNPDAVPSNPLIKLLFLDLRCPRDIFVLAHKGTALRLALTAKMQQPARDPDTGNSGGCQCFQPATQTGEAPVPSLLDTPIPRRAVSPWPQKFVDGQDVAARSLNQTYMDTVWPTVNRYR
jgi:hypothetical protein